MPPPAPDSLKHGHMDFSLIEKGKVAGSAEVIPDLPSLVICTIEAEKLTIFPACLELSVVK